MEIRYFAGAADAAGSSSVQLSLPDTELSSLIRQLGAGNAKLAEVLARCSILVDGAAAHDDQQLVPSGAQVDVLPPFAGG